MMISDSIMSYVDVVLIIYVLFSLLRGLRKGLLISLIDLVGSFVVIFLSYKSYPMFLKMYDFSSYFNFDTSNFVLNSLSHYANDIAWFLILVFIGFILIAILKFVIRKITEIPMIKQINILFGGVFGVAKAFVVICLLCVGLESPLFKNGRVVVTSTMLLSAEQTACSLYTPYKDVITRMQTATSIMYKKDVNNTEDGQELIGSLIDSYLESETGKEQVESYNLDDQQIEQLKETITKEILENYQFNLEDILNLITSSPKEESTTEGE